MDLDSSRVKRQRSSSVSSSSSGESDVESDWSPAPKYHRATTSGSLPFTCNLAPTCSQPGTETSYATEAELERHQDSFHRWVCRTPIRNKAHTDSDTAMPESFATKRGARDGHVWKECGKVFPDERMLFLVETHDPLARVRRERGEKIFQCFVPQSSCQKSFLNPSRRRKHLIAKHHYPEQYFFSITNHGINQIVREDGLAMSLIRPKREWTKGPREATKASAVEPEPILDSSTLQAPATQKTIPELAPEAPPDVDMDKLVDSMQSSLMFVPPKIRKKQAAAGK